MRKFNLNWGVVLAAIVLLLYTYISFLGNLYKFDGDIVKATIRAVVTIVLVSACVYTLVTAKITKSKLAGLIGQIVFGCVILAVFLISGAPFTSFLKAAGSRNAINSAIEDVKTSAKGLDSKYNFYAEQRVKNYSDVLQEEELLKSASLKRRLLPDNLSDCQNQRQDWISQIGKMSIWNIKMPQNLLYMQQCVWNWRDDYVRLSDLYYEDEPSPQPFKYDEFDESLSSLMHDIKNAGYSFWAILVAVLAALTMMLPYWLAIPVKTRKAGEIIWKEQINH